MNKKKLATIALIPTLSVAALLGSVYAASSTTTTTPSTWSSMKAFHAGMGRDSATFAQDLATALGLSATDIKARLDNGETPNAIITSTGKSVSDVMAALHATHLASMKTKLQADVTAGTITQAKADQILAAMANHVGGMQRGGHGPKDSTQFASDLASVLGLNQADVKAKLDAGATPLSIITQAGKTETDVMAQMKTLRIANMKTNLQAAVAAGTMTQAQADARLTQETNEPHMGHAQHGRMHNSSRATNTTNTQ